MGDTTLTVRHTVKDRLEDHRAETHDTWSDTLNEMMNLLPTIEDFKDGCIKCGTIPHEPGQMSESGGVVNFFSVDYEDTRLTESNYFCSPDCAAEHRDEINNQFPTHPDAVLVGGRQQLQAELEDATFHIDGESRSVILDVPGAFAGESSHGNEYDYLGEPVYIENSDRIVKEGVIDDIIHEETSTILILGHDHEVTRLNHPNEEKRIEYKEQHAKWSSAECANCGVEMYYMVDDPPEKCASCGTDEW